jgi:hypothetical protein
VVLGGEGYDGGGGGGGLGYWGRVPEPEPWSFPPKIKLPRPKTAAVAARANRKPGMLNEERGCCVGPDTKGHEGAGTGMGWL